MTTKKVAFVTGLAPQAEGLYPTGAEYSPIEKYLVQLVRGFLTMSGGGADQSTRIGELEQTVSKLEQSVAALTAARHRDVTQQNTREMDSSTLTERVKDSVKAYMQRVGLEYSVPSTRGRVYAAIYRDFNLDNGLSEVPETKVGEIMVDAYVRLGFGFSLREFIDGYSAVVNIPNTTSKRRKKTSGRKRKRSAK